MDEEINHQPSQALEVETEVPSTLSLLEGITCAVTAQEREKVYRRMSTEGKIPWHEVASRTQADVDSDRTRLAERVKGGDPLLLLEIALFKAAATNDDQHLARFFSEGLERYLGHMWANARARDARPGVGLAEIMQTYHDTSGVEALHDLVGMRFDPVTKTSQPTAHASILGSTSEEVVTSEGEFFKKRQRGEPIEHRYYIPSEEFIDGLLKHLGVLSDKQTVEDLKKNHKPEKGSHYWGNLPTKIKGVNVSFFDDPDGTNFTIFASMNSQALQKALDFKKY